MKSNNDSKKYLEYLSYVGESIEQTKERIMKKRQKKLDKWRKSNNGKISLCRASHKRRTLIKNQGNYTTSEWKNTIKDFNNICPMCNKRFTKKDPATVDHIIPVSKKGGNTIENIQPLHSVCNSKKGQKIINYKNKKIC